MKVLLVNTVPLEANGISTFIINSAKVLSEQNVKVTIAAPNIVSSDLKNQLRKKNIIVVEILNRMRNPIHYFFKLKQLLAKNNYDIVHINGNSTTMAVELLAAKQEKVGMRIAHSHNTTTEHPAINKLLRGIFERCVNGRLACNEAAGKWLFKNRDFTIIKNGIFLKDYAFNSSVRNEIRKKYKISDDDILIGHVGMFNYQKNQQFFVNFLKNMDPEYKLMLIGEGPNSSDIKKQFIENNLESRVIFTGAVNNVKDYLNAFDTFVLPSRFEGQPFVIIEALASGLPVVVSTNVSEEINLTGNVKFISLKDINKWKNAINTLNMDTNLRKENSMSNRTMLQKKGYDVESNIRNELLPFYKRHLN